MFHLKVNILEFDEKTMYCIKEAIALSFHHPHPLFILKQLCFRELCTHSLTLALVENV